MSILWMGSGWWSVAGLCLDISGFALLAWDLLPEYVLNVRERRLAPLLDEINLRAQQAAERGRLGELMNATLSDKDLLTLQAALDLAEIYPQPPLERLAGDVVWLELPAAMEGVIRDKRNQLAARLRPPIRLGIGLIILGFVLQVWGSIPLPVELPAAAILAFPPAF